MPIESIKLPRDDEGTPIERVSSRYGIPQNEVEALIAGKPLQRSEPHPLTMGALMDRNLTHSTKPVMHDEKQSWTPIAVLGAILGVIGTLSLIVLLVFIMRTPKKGQQPATNNTTSVPTTPAIDVIPVPLTIDTIEPVAEVTPPVQPQVEKAKTPLKRRQSVTRSYLTTSNSLEAEEKLAELRAEGNRKAKINISSKNGITTYKVQ